MISGVQTESGCVPVNLTREMGNWLNKSSSSPNSIPNIYREVTTSIETTGLSSDELGTIIENIKSNPGFLLQGRTIPYRSAETKLLFNFSAFSAQELIDLFNADALGKSDPHIRLRELSGNLRLGDSLSAADPGSRVQRHFVIQCFGELSEMLPASEAKEACTDLALGISAFYGRSQTIPEFLTPTTKLVSEGKGCLPSCEKVSYAASRDNTRVLHGTILARQFLPYRRKISWTKVNTQIVIYLSPLGQMEGLIAHNNTASPTAEFAATLHSLIFDGVWNRLSNGKSNYIRRDLLESNLKAHKLNLASSRFSFEQPENDRTGSITMAFIDFGLDLGQPALQGRIALSTKLEGHLNDHSELGPAVFSNIFEAISQAPDAAWMLSSRSVFDTSPSDHATQMASILVRNLTKVRLHIIPYLNHANRAPFAANYLKKIGAKVVNLSFDGAASAFDCDSEYSTLFTLCPEILFVAGAGNTGSENPNTCPGRVAAVRDFPNVISVAGHDSKGLIDRGSSFGTEVAHIAAPFAYECIDRRSSIDEPASTIGTCYGTSVATAYTSNLAAKYQLKYPLDSAAQTKNAILASCKNVGLPVRCGGVIDPFFAG